MCEMTVRELRQVAFNHIEDLRDRVDENQLPNVSNFINGFERPSITDEIGNIDVVFQRNDDLESIQDQLEYIQRIFEKIHAALLDNHPDPAGRAIAP